MKVHTNDRKVEINKEVRKILGAIVNDGEAVKMAEEIDCSLPASVYKADVMEEEEETVQTIAKFMTVLGTEEAHRLLESTDADGELPPWERLVERKARLLKAVMAKLTAVKTQSPIAVL